MILLLVVVVEVWYATLWKIAPNSSKSNSVGDDESTRAFAAQLLILITLNNKYITIYTLLYTTLFLCDTRRCDNFFRFNWFTSSCVLDDDTYIRKEFKHDLIDDGDIIKLLLGLNRIFFEFLDFFMPCETDFTLVGGFRGNLYPIWFDEFIPPFVAHTHTIVLVNFLCHCNPVEYFLSIF